jgi:hypothetical protein
MQIKVMGPNCSEPIPMLGKVIITERGAKENNRLAQPRVLRPGLPDASFSCQTSQFWHTFKGLRMKNIGIFVAIWNSLRSFGIHIFTPFL